MDALNDTVMVVRRVQAARIISRRYRLLRDPFRRYNAEQFRCRYRLSKRAVRRLIALLADQLGSRGRGNMPVPIAHKVLLALRYFATGTFLRCCGDMINVHESTVCRVVHRVARAIAALHPNYIAMANEDEQRDISTAFYVHAGIPGVIGITAKSYNKSRRTMPKVVRGKEALVAKLNQDLHGKNLDNVRICSAFLYQKDDPDWVPSVGMTGQQRSPEKAGTSSRYSRRGNRTQQRLR
ncbi:putative nuclease HARBI1 [Merluccius polli]|uniref:Nuclease HARBI1 n=1 Tax=Merluccius polli TaxID=89951 RepID=A0AA47NC61_MERPO|nr:putative nuclease HARBI1 [Merluccius polli]